MDRCFLTFKHHHLNINTVITYTPKIGKGHSTNIILKPLIIEIRPDSNKTGIPLYDWVFLSDLIEL